MLSREEYLRRYPTASYEMYVETEQMVKKFYSMPTNELNKAFQEMFEENKAKGYSND